MSFCFGDGCHCAYFRLSTFVRLSWQAQLFLADLLYLGGCTAVAVYLRRLSPAAADVALLPQKSHLLCGLSCAFCSTVASFSIRSWVGAHAFFAARTKFYGHTQKRRKHCRSFSEFRCTYTSLTTYIPLPLWLFPGLRVWSSLICCQFLLLCVSILLF